MGKGSVGSMLQMGGERHSVTLLDSRVTTDSNVHFKKLEERILTVSPERSGKYLRRQMCLICCKHYIIIHASRQQMIFYEYVRFLCIQLNKAQ